ncbi:Ubiquinone/menaquinone biosynthesis C-methylase UbiE [Lentzea fradiae]|uniref:Ubiquinone/menaquinone biosynthesis C-methylase UbiE n=1 Tax=Lentzea fradiae TaxID=200378 RepID=A0A1G7SII7_9PSEU|nr:class I SAM-dependent methyltransferase [Lentzea fradiae]SDG22813.1 Ubiquinone/menaquinone biosynthesis C-methylase UbiE [Lentzea fradiae]
MTDRERLRTTFGEDAARYHRARPTYPPELFTRLTGPRILEIGPGTGQATLPLTALGDVTAVELSPAMAALARTHAPAAHVVVADFDVWPLPPDPFDLVVSATAFHWLDPATRMARCAAALRPGGSLAVISTHHVAGGTGRFFAEVQEVYERWDPDTPPGLRLSPAEEIPRELDESDLFEEPEFHRYEWELAYDTAAYVDLINTYSNHIALPDRDRLVAGVAELIDTRFGGRIVKRYLTQLALARRCELRDTPN